MNAVDEGRVPVTFEPGGTTVWVAPGASVLSAARRAGIVIPAPCGGRGICGGCGVRVLQGHLEDPDAGETRGLRFAPGNVRLACMARVAGPVTLRAVVVSESRSAAVARGEGESRRRLVAAVDLGTTSVTAVVIDAESGVEVGRGTTQNHQTSWGGDVLSRVQAAVDGEGADLAAAADASVLAALAESCDQAGSCVAGIERLVIAGNTAMSALLLRADVGTLASHPFTLPYEGVSPLPDTSAVAGALAPGAETVVLPPLGGFIGGDVTAGLVATGLARPDGVRLLLDLGTNAEVVCTNSRELVGASAAAGPAFEGFGIRSGGPAAPGAVQRASFEDGTLKLDVIGGGAPAWLCGSGLVSVAALLRSLGHLTAEGMLVAEGPLEERFVRVDGVLAIRLWPDGPHVDGTASHGEVLFTQQDVRAFQLAKGAVLTAVRFVLDRAGAAHARISDVAVAGAFGAALIADDLVELGVVPPRLSGALRVAGNTSLDGAAMIALDPALEAVAESLHARFVHVDLAAEPTFSSAFLDALGLEPQTAS